VGYLKLLAELDLLKVIYAQSACGKKPKTTEIRGEVIKKSFFGSVPKSRTQKGSFSVKKRE
jgi:hypothetical protein